MSAGEAPAQHGCNNLTTVHCTCTRTCTALITLARSAEFCTVVNYFRTAVRWFPFIATDAWRSVHASLGRSRTRPYVLPCDTYVTRKANVVVTVLITYVWRVIYTTFRRWLLFRFLLAVHCYTSQMAEPPFSCTSRMGYHCELFWPKIGYSVISELTKKSLCCIRRNR
jgi:hypothetical protein